MVLKGLKGTGKDTVGGYVGGLFPRNRVNIGNMHHLIGRFNGHFANALLVHVEEGFWSGDHQGENIAQEPRHGADRLDRAQGQGPRPDALCPCGCLMSSNDDWVVPATADERRYAVFDVDPRARQPGGEYFEPIYAERDNGGLGALLHYLQPYDLTNFKVRRPPQTKGLANQKIAGLKGFDRYWLEILQKGELPKEFDAPSDDGWPRSSTRIITTDLHQFYIEWFRHRRYQGDLPSEILWAMI